MTKLAVVIATIVASTVSAYPIYGYYPGSTQSTYHNSGAYDNGVSSSISPYGTSYNSWNDGFSATQGNYATPYGNAGSSSYNQWSNNAWSNSYGGYPRRYW